MLVGFSVAHRWYVDMHVPRRRVRKALWGRDQAEPEHGLGTCCTRDLLEFWWQEVSSQALWEGGVPDKVSKCQSEIEKLTRSQDSKLLLRHGTRFCSGQPKQTGPDGHRLLST